MRVVVLLASCWLALALGGCATQMPPPSDFSFKDDDDVIAAAYETEAGYVEPIHVSSHPDTYRLDTGDQVRIYVFGQPELSRIYTVDAAGRISVPLIQSITARGRTTRELERIIRSRLGASFVRDPYVSAEVATYRPFFILGEVRNPGQYPYVIGMTLENAVAVAGGYSPRAKTGAGKVTRTSEGHLQELHLGANESIIPGDRIMIDERWF